MESIKMLCYEFPDKAYVTLHGLADTHRPRTEPLERYEMDLQQKVARLKPIYMCVLTSWMRYGDYGAEKMLKPNGVHPNWVKLYGGERQVEVTQS